MSEKPGRWLRVRLSTVLLTTALVATCLGWAIDHRREVQELTAGRRDYRYRDLEFLLFLNKNALRTTQEHTGKNSQAANDIKRTIGLLENAMAKLREPGRANDPYGLNSRPKRSKRAMSNDPATQGS